MEVFIATILDQSTQSALVFNSPGALRLVRTDGTAAGFQKNS